LSILGCSKSGQPTDAEPERVRESEPLAGTRAPDFDAEYGPAPPGTGWMQVTVGKTRYELGAAAHGQGELEAHVHEPNSSKPRFVMWTPNAGGLDLSVGGLSFRLPGRVEQVGFTITNPPRGESWASTEAVLVVTEFGAVGAPVTGWFRGTMSARLNRDPEPIRGRFRVTRAPDRHSP
jgi:hypothetical protein